MALLTQAPKGTQDLLPSESAKWRTVEQVMRSEAAVHGFGEVRTPVFEHTELFLRSVGDTTDVVEKQMYTFNDKGGRSVTLRPEGTASAVRAMLEHGVYNDGLPVKVYDISDALHLPRPGVTRAVKDMEVKGYLQKQASPEDGRVTYLTITGAGRALSARYNTKYFRALVPYLGAISDQASDTMIRTIETFYQVMCERRDHLDD